MMDDWYVLSLDKDKYDIQYISLDSMEFPPEFLNNEYYIDIEYRYARYYKSPPYTFLDGREYMDTSLAACYSSITENYKQIAGLKGYTYDYDWQNRIGYFDLFRFPMDEFYSGPSIRVHQFTTFVFF